MLCSVNGCDKSVFVKKRGLCKGHYLRWWRHGNPTGGKFYIHHGMVRTPIHNAWINIKARTGNPKSQYFYCYGGRGIKMYQSWANDFMQFYNYVIDTIGDRPTKLHSIDRVNNDGNYEPGNIRWATPQQQARNHRNVRNTSGYKGVSWKRANNKWQSAIRHNGKSVYLGLFETPQDAYLAYKRAALNFYGEVL